MLRDLEVELAAQEELELGLEHGVEQWVAETSAAEAAALDAQEEQTRRDHDATDDALAELEGQMEALVPEQLHALDLEHLAEWAKEEEQEEQERLRVRSPPAPPSAAPPAAPSAAPSQHQHEQDEEHRWQRARPFAGSERRQMADLGRSLLGVMWAQPSPKRMAPTCI